MQPFRAEVPNVASAAIQPFRGEASAIIAAIAGVTPPLSAELEAELIALAYVHQDPGVRKKAMPEVTKHIGDAAAFKKAYGSMAGATQHVVAERIRAFDHPLQLGVAKAVLFHRMMAASIPFERDPEVRAKILEVMVDNAKREGESELALGSVYWYWENESGWASDFELHQLPDGFFGELTKLRERHPFRRISIHGGELTDLPSELAAAQPWLESLSLAFNPFTVLPDAVFECTNLETLELCGTELTDIPPAIAKLTKLRCLDIGNMKKMKTIPDSVCALDKLEVLRIGNGSINSIPEAIAGMTSLREIEMQSTSITKLPAAIATLPALKRLNRRFSSRLEVEAVRALVGSGVEVE
jgi:hypothetical protein